MGHMSMSLDACQCNDQIAFFTYTVFRVSASALIMQPMPARSVSFSCNLRH
eukprot:c24499_g1_i4 orf=118-270(-)